MSIETTVGEIGGKLLLVIETLERVEQKADANQSRLDKWNGLVGVLERDVKKLQTECATKEMQVTIKETLDNHLTCHQRGGDRCFVIGLTVMQGLMAIILSLVVAGKLP